MKRFFWGFVMMVLVVMTATADNPLRLKSGSLKPLKDAGQTISCTIDFSKTQGNQKPLNAYLVNDFGSSRKEFDSQVPNMEQRFSERWNKDIKKGPKYTTSNDAPFHMVIQVNNLQLGSRNGLGGASFSGYVFFYRKGEAEPFAQVEVLKQQGTKYLDPQPGYLGLHQAFNDLAEFLCKLIKKAK